MYSNNEKISLRQFKRLAVLDLFSIFMIIIPYLITRQAGYDGIVSITIGFVITAVYLFLVLYFVNALNDTYSFRSIDCAKTWIAVLACIVYFIKFFFSGIVIVRLFSEVIRSTLLQETNLYFIIITLLLVSYYIAVKGCEVRARLSEVLYYIILVPVIILLLLGLKNVDISNLTPIFETNFSRVFSGSYSIFILLSFFELILFLKPYFHEEKTKKLEMKKIRKSLFQALGIGYIICLLIFVLTVGTIGEEVAKTSLWSSVSLFQFLKFPGSLLNRQDSLVIALWMLSMFSIISGILFYLQVTAEQIFRCKRRKVVLAIFTILLAGFACIPINLEYLFSIYMKYMCWIGMPQSILLPILFLIVNANSKKINKKVIASLLFLLLSCGCCCTLTSCNKQIEVEDRDFVQAIGIDWQDGKYKVMLVSPDLSSFTEQGTNDSEKLGKEYKVSNLYELEELYKLENAKKLDYNHLKAIVLGKDIYSSQTKLDNILTYFENNYELSKNTYVFLSKNDANTILELNNKVENGIGDYLDRLYKNNLADSEKKEVALGHLLNEKHNYDLTMQIPLLDVNDEIIRVIGQGIVRNSQCLLLLDDKQSVYFDLLSGYGDNSRIFLNSKEEHSSDLIIRLDNMTCSKRFQLSDDNKPKVQIIVEGTAVLENESSFINHSNITTLLNSQTKTTEMVNEKLTQILNQQADTIIKEKKIDYLNLLRTSRYKNKKMYDLYKNKEEQFLQDLNFEVIVQIKIF